MSRFTRIVSLTLCAILALSGCSQTSVEDTESTNSDTSAQSTDETSVTYQWDFVSKSTGINDLKEECDQQGTVVQMEYETLLYSSAPDQIVTKTLYIYLPYGYDESQEYDILYLMHGGGESEEYWLAGERFGQTTCNVLDNMIAQGLCDPFIVVTPTFYEPETGDSAEVNDSEESVESSEESTESEESAESEADETNEELTYTFAEELRNNVIPAVESVYSTYADGDVSEENLIATRDHRAFAGLSMGSITSIHSALMENIDIISWVGSYSGAKTDVDEFQAALESDQYKDYTINFWYNGNGKADVAHDEHDEFCHGVLEAMPDRFVDGENFAWVDLRDGSHSYASWVAHLYNCMLVFFR